MLRELCDYLGPELDLVFVGINPGEWAAKAGHYYANPRNIFWNCLYKSGLTRVRLEPQDDKRVLEFGLGLTDRVKRWTKSANELRANDFKQGADELRRRLEGQWPRLLAFNGKAGLRWVLGSDPDYGWQSRCFGISEVYVLPSTSPANASISQAEKVRHFCCLAERVRRNVQ